MRSKDFIREAGRNGSSEFDVDPNAKRADTPDWLKNAGKWFGNKIGMNEPVPLGAEAEKFGQELAAKRSGYTGIDPVQRQQAGMAPATHQEISDYLEKNPSIVQGLTDRNGNPIVSGGLKDVERAARAAAPSFGGQTDEFGGITSPAVAAVAAEPAAAEPAAAEPAAAGAGAPAKEPAARDLERLKDLAGVKDPTAPAAEPPVAVKDPLAAVAPGSLGSPSFAGVAAAAPASGGGDPTQDLFIRDKSDDKFDRPEKKKTQNVEPVPDLRLDLDQQKKRQSGGDRKPWGTVKDKDGRQVFIDKDGGKWVWPANSSSWKPANMVPGSDYVDKKLPTTTGYTPPSSGSQGAEPAQPSNPAFNRFKTVDAVDAEIKRFSSKYDMSLPANQRYIQNLKARKSELVGRNVNESSGIDRMRFLAGLIKD